VMDDFGQPVTGATVTFGSGTDYNKIPAGVPEPSSLMMLGVALMGVATLIFEKSRSMRPR
jgi:hypothetical protein